MMKLKLIACEVFTREIGLCVAHSPHTIDLEFTPKNAHDNSDNLRDLLQEKIVNADSGNYDAVLLGIGLCGNSTAGIRAHKTKIIIPRAHDCCSIFLGSRQKFRELFENRPSTPFTSAGYMERGSSLMHEASDFTREKGFKQSYEEYVEIYGEESAKYLWETLHQSTEDNNQDIVFIDIPELSGLGYEERARKWAEEYDKTFIYQKGSLDLIKKLIDGDWNDDEFQTIQSGQKIDPVYDWDRIIQAG